MEKRTEELSKLKSYTHEIDKDLTMILQSLQWDRKHILEHSPFVTCKYDENHKVLLDRVEDHEKNCLLKQNGYTKEDIFLPEPLDPKSNTLIKFSKEDIALIVKNAAQSSPNFKKVFTDIFYGFICLYLPNVVGSGELPPQTLERLQATYSTDERRAIYEAVVSAAPACHDLTDLALVSVGDDKKTPKTKSRMEILAELRDMRRRRTKYRVAAKSTNYSDVLRDVIKTQMEVYTEALGETQVSVNEHIRNNTTEVRTQDNHNSNTKNGSRDRYEHKRDISNREHNRKERSDIDKGVRRRDRRRSGDEKLVKRSRERRRDDRDYMSRLPSVDIKLEVKEEDDMQRDSSLETRHLNRSKDRIYDEKRDTSHRHRERIYIKKERPDSAMYQESSRERHDEDHSRIKKRRKEKNRSKERYDERVREISELNNTRAQNLIVEIKRERESAERDESEERDRDDFIIKNINRHIEYESRKERHHYNEDVGHGSRQRDRNRDDKDKDYRDEQRYKKRRHDESRESSRRGDVDKYMRYEYYDQNKSKRDRIIDN